MLQIALGMDDIGSQLLSQASTGYAVPSEQIGMLLLVQLSYIILYIFHEIVSLRLTKKFSVLVSLEQLKGTFNNLLG